jgi:hypothetical protein
MATTVLVQEGEGVALKARFLLEDGITTADVSGVQLFIERGDGTQMAPVAPQEVNEAGVDLWRYDFAPDRPGIWQYEFRADSPKAIADGHFVVQPSAI